MKIDKLKFLTQPTIISNMVYEYFGQQLSKEQQDEFINKICNKDYFDIKLTIDGIEIPFDNVNEFLVKYLELNFQNLMLNYMHDKVFNKINDIKDMLDNVQQQIEKQTTSLDLNLEQ